MSAELVALLAERLERGDVSSLAPEEYAAAQRIVDAVELDTDAVVLAAAYAAEFQLDLGDIASSLEHPDEDTLLITAQPPRKGALVAATAVRQGQLRQAQNDLAGASHYFRWASDIFHSFGERAGESLTRTLLGRVLEMQGRLEEAYDCYEQALKLDQALDDRVNEAVDLGLLGQVEWLRGRLDAAERFSHQALAIHRRERDWRNAVGTLMTLGHVAEERGQPLRARYYYLRSALAMRKHA